MPSVGTVKVNAQVSYRWWLMPYLGTLEFFCEWFDMEPDWEKVERVMEAGIVVSAVVDGKRVILKEK